MKRRLAWSGAVIVVAALCLVLGPDVAWATDGLGGLVTRAGTDISGAVANIGAYACYGIGTVAGGASAVQGYRSLSAGDGWEELMKPVGGAVFSALLLGAPYFTEVLQNTIDDTGSKGAVVRTFK
jgi:hypothetical protein